MSVSDPIIYINKSTIINNFEDSQVLLNLTETFASIDNTNVYEADGNFEENVHLNSPHSVISESISDNSNDRDIDI